MARLEAVEGGDDGRIEGEPGVGCAFVARLGAAWRLSTLWSVFGALATILPLVPLYFMVVKPE